MLSDRLYQVWGLMAQGYSNRGIASELGVKVKTIRNYTNFIYTRLGIEYSADRDSRVIAAKMYNDNHC